MINAISFYIKQELLFQIQCNNDDSKKKYGYFLSSTRQCNNWIYQNSFCNIFGFSASLSGYMTTTYFVLNAMWFVNVQSFVFMCLLSLNSSRWAAMRYPVIDHLLKRHHGIMRGFMLLTLQMIKCMYYNLIPVAMCTMANAETVILCHQLPQSVIWTRYQCLNCHIIQKCHATVVQINHRWGGLEE